MSGPTEHLSNADSLTGRLIGATRGRIGGTLHQFRGDGLRARAMRGSGWTLFGFGTSQVLRLGSNLILTRLLFPEAFGLMALASVFQQGLNMLSNIGVRASVIQNERGDDPDFLATAWTMQVIRGFTLFLCMCALAYPASLIYEQPLLLPILIMLGLTSIIQGFQSIGMTTASRKMLLGRLTLIDLVAQGVGIVVMIVWAYYSRDVWALVGGGIAGGLVRVGLGHRILGSLGNRFHFERTAVKDIYHFGKWIFIATALTYFGGQGLRLIQAALVPIDTLGQLSIAGVMAMLGKEIVDRLSKNMLFPVFSEIRRERPKHFARKVIKARWLLVLSTAPIFLPMILFGKYIIEFLYDTRYHDAGLYLVILATGGGVVTVKIFFTEALIALGKTRDHAFLRFVGTFLNMSGVVVGFALSGVDGMLWGVVVASLLAYPFEVAKIHQYGMWTPVRDIMGFAVYIIFGIMSALYIG